MRKHIIIWTDASWENNAGYIGVVVYVFDDDQFYFAHAPVPAWIVLAWTPGAQKIGRAEVAAEIIPYFLLPFDMLYERRVIHFVDNTSALHCILNGYSRVPDTSWMVNLFHCFNCFVIFLNASCAECRNFFGHASSATQTSSTVPLTSPFVSRKCIAYILSLSMNCRLFASVI